jgi:transmembrane sensor
MKQQDSSEKHLADAIECLQCLIDPHADPKVRARWVAWLGADPKHRAAYKRAEATWRRPLPDDLWPSAEELEDDSYDPDVSVGEHHRRAQPSRLRLWGTLLTTRPAFAGLGLAAVLLMGIVIGVYVSKPRPAGSAGEAIVYETERGEQRRIALEDGSAVVLGPLSRVRVPKADRSVELLGGEAYFSIVHDAAHPFEVSAGSGQIRDVGTAFNVAVRSDRVVVTVADGAVSVATNPEAGGAHPVLVEHDQQVAYTDRVGAVSAVDAGLATGWTRGRLAYVDRPLSEVTAELSRFSKTDVTVADPAVGALHYTGTVSVDAIDQWAISLAKVYPVRVERTGTRLVLRSALKP